MKTYYFSFFLLMFIFFSCGQQKSNNTNTSKEITFTKQGSLEIMDSLNSPKAHFDIEFATDEYSRQTGLMYRKSMKDNQAMLFVFEDEVPRYFYMKNTYISLDIIYISAQNKIVSFAKNAKPLDETALPSHQAAKYVLEIKSGLADQYHLTINDKVLWHKE